MIQNEGIVKGKGRMKVILNKDVANLGEEGDIKDVARGYARNFLIPKKLVMPYTPESLAILESRREAIEQRRAEKSRAAMDTRSRLEAEPLVIEMPAGDKGRLFGSVTSATICDALAAQGITVERKRIEIPEKTIKQVGTTRVRVRLYGDEEAELRVVVNPAGGAVPGDTAEKAEVASPGKDEKGVVSAEEVAAEEITAEADGAAEQKPDAEETADMAETQPEAAEEPPAESEAETAAEVVDEVDAEADEEDPADEKSPDESIADETQT
jgi:large subunit ribosomal protein L9